MAGVVLILKFINQKRFLLDLDVFILVKTLEIFLVTQSLYLRNTDLGVIHPGRLLLNGFGPVGVVYLGEAVVAPVRPVQTNVVLHARVVHSLHNN
jgi:hypothetical protein